MKFFCLATATGGNNKSLPIFFAVFAAEKTSARLPDRSDVYY